MNKRIISRLAVTGLVAAALVAGFVWLYQHSVTVDASQQQRILAVAEKVKQLDSRWNVDVLRNATGLNHDYDPLTAPLTEWPKLRSQLKDELASIRSDQVDTFLKKIDDLFTQKATGINEFKARNSVLVNSVRFLPTAQTEIAGIIALERDRTVKGSRSVSQIAAKLDRALLSMSGTDSGETKSNSADARAALLDLRNGLKGAARDTAAMQNTFAMTATDSAISALVSSALRYNLSPSETLATELRTLSASIKESLPTLAPTLQEAVRSLVTHTEVVLRERTVVTGLLSRVNAVPINASVDNLVSAISRGFAKHVSDQATYATLLQGYIVLVLAVLFAAAVLLIRQWMSIKGELQSSNAQLEFAELKLAQFTQLATVGEMSANLAHEVNTPLGAALNNLWMMRESYQTRLLPYVEACQSLITAGNAETVPELRDQWANALALGCAFDPLAKQDFADCLENGTLCLDQIKDVVVNVGELSRVGQGTSAETSLEKPINVALKAIAFLTKGSAVSVETRFGTTPEIECNIAAIQQALVNILKNAVQAMPGGGKIVVETGCHGRDMVYIVIADTGSGMSPAVQARIFDRHFGTKANGSGIGLSITKNIIAEHGGEIAVKSTVGEGTKFAISLPIKMSTMARQSSERLESVRGPDDV